MVAAVYAADADLTYAFELLAPSLRVFQRAVGCLAKLGRDAAVILRADELILHGADDAHSSAMQFAFRRRCFRSTPAMRAATAAPGAAVAQEASVVVVARALLGALRGAQQRMAESLLVGLSGSADGEQPKLVLQFTARYGATVRHRVPLLETSAFLPGEPNAGPHTAALSPVLLSRVLDHCSPPAKVKGGAACEEVSVVAEPKEGIRVRSYDLLGGGGRGGAQETRSEVLIQRSDLEACHLDARGGEVTLSGRGLRDFAKAAEGYMRDLDSLHLLEGSPLLELRFGNDGGTVICRLATASEGVVKSPQDFSAVLLVATRDLSAGDEVPDPAAVAVPETQPAAATQGTPSATGRRPQPRQGSKRRAVATLPAASAFDAFPDHSATGPSQSFSVPVSPVPATAPRPAAPAVPAFKALQAQVQQERPPARPMMPPASVQHPSCLPTPPTFNAAPATMAGLSAVQAESVPLLHSPPESQHIAPSASPPPTAPAPVHQNGQWLWQNAQAQPQSQHQPQPRHSIAHSDLGYSPFTGGRQPMLASQLAAKEGLATEDSDDECIGADPDEVAFARGDPAAGEDSVDWFDVDKLW